jgi:hypothetical protein
MPAVVKRHFAVGPIKLFTLLPTCK